MNKTVREPEVECQFEAWQCDACGAEVSFEDTTCSGCGADIGKVADEESSSSKSETDTRYGSKQPRPFAFILIGVLIAIVIGGIWLYSSPSRDSSEMNRMAEKLRASVKKSLNEENFMAANHLATVSCIFAREMDCVAGKPPNTQSSARDTRPPQLLRPDEVKEIIESRILKSDVQIGEWNVASYMSSLRSALSEDDIRSLEDIRKRHGYWDALSTALKH